MLIGATQPEMGRLKVSGDIRRSQANRRAAELSRGRHDIRRPLRAVATMIAAVVRREPEPRPTPSSAVIGQTATAAESPC